MVRRILSIALVALGLVAVALAIASATAWRDSETVTAALPAEPEAPLVVTAPGVLDLLNEEVSIRASAADGAPVVLAVGRQDDVTAWVGDAAHVAVTGLSSWSELAASASEGSDEAPSPAGADMWLAEATGEGEAELDWTADDGRYTLIAATDGTAPAPMVELTWSREVSTPFLVPGIVLGALLVLAGAFLAYQSRRQGSATGPGAPPRFAGRGSSDRSATEEERA